MPATPNPSRPEMIRNCRRSASCSRRCTRNCRPLGAAGVAYRGRQDGMRDRWGERHEARQDVQEKHDVVWRVADRCEHARTVLDLATDGGGLGLTCRHDPCRSCRSRRKMGEEVVAIDADPGTELVARIDRDDSLEQLTGQRADVVVDFTVLDAARRRCTSPPPTASMPSSARPNSATRISSRFGRVHVVERPDCAELAIGAVLMIRMAELAAPHFETAEIIEFHNAKVDARPVPPPTPLNGWRPPPVSGPMTRRRTRCTPVLGAGSGQPASGCTGCAWWERSPTRRSSSAPPGRP